MAGLPSTTSSLKVCFPSSCAPQSIPPAPPSCFPSYVATVGFFAVGQESSHQLPVRWGGGGRIWEVDAWRSVRRHSCLSLPRCPWGRRGEGTQCSVQRVDLQGNSPVVESRLLQCLCPRDSRVSRAWRWALVGRTVQAAGVLSAKISASSLHFPPRGARSSPAVGLRAGISVPALVRLLLLRSCNTHPGPAEHPLRWKERE